MLSSLVRWDHSDSWEVPTAAEFLALSSGGSGNGAASSVEINVSSPDSEDAYLAGHVIDGRVLFPATGYLVLAWRQLARMNGQTYQQTPVSFDDIHIHRATMLPSTGESERRNCDTDPFLSGMGQLGAADSAPPTWRRDNSAQGQLDAGDSARGHFGAASVTVTSFLTYNDGTVTHLHIKWGVAVSPIVVGAGTRHLPPSRIHAPVTNLR